MARLTQFLRDRSQEQQQVAFMLATGFFLGVFIATYQITAESLFINKLSDQLSKATLIAGLLGIAATFLFSFFQNFIRFSLLTQISVGVIFSVLIVFFSALHYGDPAWHDTVLFLQFAMIGPITAIMLLSYWGTFGRLFNFKQSKSIIGWIDTGQLIAAILASFLIPATSWLLPETSDYLMVSSVSILMVGVLLFVINQRFTLSKNDPREVEKEVRSQTTLVKILSDRYVLLLSLFLLVSMVMFMFSQYSFQLIVKEQYPGQRELTDFNAFFTGAIYGLSLLMQTFVNARIISNYGLRVSLLVLPVIVGVLALGAITTGIIFGFDKATSTGFIYFFLFIALGRLFNWIFRDSLENPVFKLFFIPLEGKVRFNIQSKVEGMISESARFMAGLLIFVFAFFPFFNIMYITGLIVILVGAYFVVINKLYAGYKGKIREKLENTDYKNDKLEKGFTKIAQKLETMLQARNPSQAVFSFRLLEKFNASNLTGWVNALVRNEDEMVHHFAQQKLNEVKGLSVSDKYVIRLDEGKVQGAEKNVLSSFDLKAIIENGGEVTKTRIQKLTRSTDSNDRHYAAELLLHTSQDECISYLIELLNDSDTVVRNTAIKTASKKFNNEIIAALIENLGNPAFSNQAMNTLVLIGSKTLPALDAAFYRSGQSTQIILRIIQAMGRIGGQRAKDLLWNKIDYPNKVVVSQVLLALGECGFKAGITQITRIKYAIENDIADIRWNLSAIQELEETGISKEIAEALQWEVQNDIEHIYMLLAMLYDTRSIQLVKENIDSGTSEGITYAVELLDIFLSDQLKQRVIPILDDLPASERIARLDAFYPRVKLDSRLVLKFIINRDFSQSNRWTKACVLFQVGLLRQEEFKLDLIAQLFNPDGLIREVSAWALYQLSPNEYDVNTRRLGASVKKELDAIVIHALRISRFEKVLFYRKFEIFEGVPGITLTYLADFSEENDLAPGEQLLLDDVNDFYLLLAGSVDYFQKGEFKKDFGAGQFIGEMLAAPNYLNTNRIVAKESAKLVRFNKERFYELLADNVKLTGNVVEFI